jgi:hypothetical protein
VYPVDPHAGPERVRCRCLTVFYNGRRLHQSLDYHTPEEMYFGTRNSKLAAAA